MQAIIFDLGNVLVDYDHAKTTAALAALSTVHADAIANLLSDVGHAMNVGELSGQQLHQILVDRAGITPAYADFAAATCAGLTRNDAAFAAALELQARPEVTVAVLSNTNDVHAAWLDANLSQLAEIDLVMLSHEVQLAKPDPAIYRLALELLDVPAANAIFVDDLADNIAGAEAIGIAGIVHRDWATTQAQIEAWLAR